MGVAGPSRVTLRRLGRCGSNRVCFFGAVYVRGVCAGKCAKYVKNAQFSSECLIFCDIFVPRV